MHVAEAFFAGGLGLEVVLDAVGEMVGFGLEVRRVVGRVRLVDLLAGEFSPQMKAVVGEGVVNLDPSL